MSTSFITSTNVSMTTSAPPPILALSPIRIRQNSMILGEPSSSQRGRSISSSQPERSVPPRSSRPIDVNGGYKDTWNTNDSMDKTILVHSIVIVLPSGGLRYRVALLQSIVVILQCLVEPSPIERRRRSTDRHIYHPVDDNVRDYHPPHTPQWTDNFPFLLKP